MVLSKRQQHDIKKQPAEAANNNSAPSPRLVVDNTHPENSERRTTNVQVERQKPAAADSNYPTISDEFATRQEEDTTAAQLRKQTEESKREWEENQAYIEEQERKKRVTKFVQRRSRLSALKQKGHSVKGVAKKAKIIRASWIAGSICGTLYLAQAGFWIAGMIGIGFESVLLEGAQWLRFLPGGVVGSYIATETITYFSVGEHLFELGWIISSTIGLISLFTALAIYMAHMVNPIQKGGQTAFAVIFALTFFPLGIIPWVHIWILTVLYKHLASQ